MLLESDLLQDFKRLAVLLGWGYPAERHPHLHIIGDAQVRNEIIALKNKANTIIAVRIPITVFEVLR
ncbi:hypothetical protein D3C86_1836190 [compost metagenome]